MSIFPFISPELLEETASENLPVFQEFAYDFEHNRLKLRDGKPYLVSGNEALEVWIFKALHTPRFRHTAYSPSFGNEIKTLIGHTLDPGILNSEIRRFIIEALMVNPYIKELNNFKFIREGSRLAVEFDCSTVYGKMSERLSLKEVT
jgi:hypothetical protein